MIIVIAIIEVADGRRDEFLAEFNKIVPLVNAEEGCIEYGPAIDVPTDISVQQPMGDDVVTVIEKWESVGTLRAHLSAPHMVEYRPKVKDMVVDMKIHVLQPAVS